MLLNLFDKLIVTDLECIVLLVQMLCRVCQKPRAVLLQQEYILHHCVFILFQIYHKPRSYQQKYLALMSVSSNLQVRFIMTLRMRDM